MKNYKILQIGLALILMTKAAYAIDLQPGEVAAPKPNISIMQLSYIYSERGDRYINGHDQVGNPKIQSSTYIVRLGHSFEVAEMPAFFYVQTPMGAMHTKGIEIPGVKTDGDSGLGDTSLAFAVWPYSNRETKTYFGFAGYAVLPTGSYDHNRLFNMGENRYKTALQAGYQRQVTDSASWMMAVDGLFYGDNHDYLPTKSDLKQDNLYTLQTGLKYDFNAQYSLMGTYFYSVGGRTEVDGVNKHDLTQLHRYQLSAQGNYSFGRLTLQYGSDIKTENGYLEDHRLIMRYTTYF